MTVLPSTFEENLEKTQFSEPWQYVVETSRGKASEVAQRIKVSGSLRVAIVRQLHDIIMLMHNG